MATLETSTKAEHSGSFESQNSMNPAKTVHICRPSSPHCFPSGQKICSALEKTLRDPTAYDPTVHSMQQLGSGKSGSRFKKFHICNLGSLRKSAQHMPGSSVQRRPQCSTWGRCTLSRVVATELLLLRLASFHAVGLAVQCPGVSLLRFAWSHR